MCSPASQLFQWMKSAIIAEKNKTVMCTHCCSLVIVKRTCITQYSYGFRLVYLRYSYVKIFYFTVLFQLNSRGNTCRILIVQWFKNTILVSI